MTDAARTERAAADRGSPATSARGTAFAAPFRPTRKGPGPVATTPDLERAREVAAAAAARWSLVTARDLMREKVVCVPQDTSLPDLGRVLAEHRVSGAPVVDATGAIVGVVSMRDLVDRRARGADTSSRPEPSWFERPFEHVLEQEEYAFFDAPEKVAETVADIMTADVVSVPATAGIREIAHTMTTRRVHRVLVEREDRTGVYLGIIGTFEILDMLAE